MEYLGSSNAFGGRLFASCFISRGVFVIAKMNSILGYDNSDGFRSEPDPFTIAQRIKSENSELRALHRPRCDAAPS